MSIDVAHADHRPGHLRAAIEAFLLCLCAAGIGLALNATRRAPLSVGGPVPQSAESCVAPATEDVRPVPFIEPRLAAKRHGGAGVVFIDARPRADWTLGHIAGALNVPADEAQIEPARLTAIRAAQLVVTYCDRPQCGLSTRLGQRLRSLGVADVRVLADGWHAWFAAGYPAQSGDF
ncbi:MAG TPA: rhodanese-like domain-containing protein [Polyangia bacterium]|jgi:rhodanese-related sulfurtransferase